MSTRSVRLLAAGCAGVAASDPGDCVGPGPAGVHATSTEQTTSANGRQVTTDHLQSAPHGRAFLSDNVRRARDYQRAAIACFALGSSCHASVVAGSIASPAW